MLDGKFNISNQVETDQANVFKTFTVEQKEKVMDLVYRRLSIFIFGVLMDVANSEKIRLLVLDENGEAHEYADVDFPGSEMRIDEETGNDWISKFSKVKKRMY